MLETKVIKNNYKLLITGQICFLLGLLDYFVPFNVNFRYLACLSLVGAILTLIGSIKFKKDNQQMKNVFTASWVLIVLAISRFVIGAILEIIGSSVFIVINFVLALVGLVACAFLTHEIIMGVKPYGTDSGNEKFGIIIWKIFVAYILIAIIISAIGFMIWCINANYLVTQISNCIIFGLSAFAYGSLIVYLFKSYKLVK